MNTKKMLLAIIAISSYVSSHAMLRHASSTGVFNQVKNARNVTKRFCSTGQAKPKSGFFWKFFTGLLTGSIATHYIYETYPFPEDKNTIKNYCTYKLVSNKLGKINPQDQQAP